MPTYVYKFIDTGETIEVQQSFDDDNLTEAVHPETGATMPVRKVFLPVGITFKGDGFYKTDSRATKPSKTSKTSASSDSGGSGSSGESSGSSSGSGETSGGSASGTGTSGTGTSGPSSAGSND